MHESETGGTERIIRRRQPRCGQTGRRAEARIKQPNDDLLPGLLEHPGAGVQAGYAEVYIGLQQRHQELPGAFTHKEGVLTVPGFADKG